MAKKISSRINWIVAALLYGMCVLPSLGTSLTDVIARWLFFDLRESIKVGRFDTMFQTGLATSYSHDTGPVVQFTEPGSALHMVYLVLLIGVPAIMVTRPKMYLYKWPVFAIVATASGLFCVPHSLLYIDFITAGSNVLGCSVLAFVVRQQSPACAFSPERDGPAT